MTLGVACKKSNDFDDAKPSTEVKKAVEKAADLKPNVLGLENTGGIGGYPGGADTYPHNTGACYCGVYSVCHPKGAPQYPGGGTEGPFYPPPY